MTMIMLLAVMSTAHAENTKTTAAAIAADTESAVKPAAFVYDSASLLYHVSANASGYRTVTSVEPASAEPAPVYTITYYPEAQETGLSLTCDEEEGPALRGTNTSVILHTVIPLMP
jgi:hypothetical protein